MRTSISIPSNFSFGETLNSRIAHAERKAAADTASDWTRRHLPNAEAARGDLACAELAMVSAANGVTVAETALTNFRGELEEIDGQIGAAVEQHRRAVAERQRVLQSATRGETTAQEVAAADGTITIAHEREREFRARLAEPRADVAERIEDAKQHLNMAQSTAARCRYDLARAKAG